MIKSTFFSNNKTGERGQKRCGNRCSRTQCLYRFHLFPLFYALFHFSIKKYINLVLICINFFVRKYLKKQVNQVLLKKTLLQQGFLDTCLD